MTELIIFICFVLGTIVYLLGWWAYCDIERRHNFEFHGEGFLDSYITSDFKELTPKLLWKGSTWPLIFIWYAIKCTTWMLHEVITIVLLMFGAKYNKTRLYKKINSWLVI